MNDPARFWADPRLVYTVAAAAVALLLITVWLFRRRRKEGRQAAVICLMVSIALHAALLFLLPLVAPDLGGSSTVDPQAEAEPGVDVVSFSTFDPEMSEFADAAGAGVEAPITPLPVSNLTDLLRPEPPGEADPVESDPTEVTATEAAEEQEEQEEPEAALGSLATLAEHDTHTSVLDLDAELSELLDSPPASQSESSPADVESNPAARGSVTDSTATPADHPTQAPAAPASVPGMLENDFASRRGSAKQEALRRTGGSVETEAAVAAALRFLADAQRADGAWDPRASGAGKERSPLGMTRGGAGTRAETAITGLALLTMMGAGQTHHEGEYSENVYRGLAYLIRTQHPNGSLAGNASVYAANYSHGMAALAMCEAAALTRDPSAILSAQRAIAHTRRLQHPTTGGWRYTEGDPGDLSQLGWQAMVLDAGHRAQIPIDPQTVAGVERFLRSVRAGSHGGLASYRPGEAPSRTMTAEALATRLLIGQRVPAAEIAEAERYLLQQPPGVGQDNYYYWYYATLALHQLQDDAWNQWNQALQGRLLATQRSDGGWSSDTMWGGYGGTVYTTSMAALCLEAYYRHALRDDSPLARRPPPHRTLK